MVGKNVKIRGDLKFQKLLRIDGFFQGNLISKGDVIIGESGESHSNISGIREMLIDGKHVGNIVAELVIIRETGLVFGNITAKWIEINAGATVVGIVNINPLAPEFIDHLGNVIPDPFAPTMDTLRMNSSSVMKLFDIYLINMLHLF